MKENKFYITTKQQQSLKKQKMSQQKVVQVQQAQQVQQPIQQNQIQQYIQQIQQMQQQNNQQIQEMQQNQIRQVQVQVKQVVQLNQIQPRQLQQQQRQLPLMEQFQQIEQWRPVLYQNAQNNQKCRSCQEEYKGFKCVEGQIHKLCSYCQNELPKRNLNEDENAELQLFCQIYENYSCKAYYGDCPSSYMLQVKNLAINPRVFAYRFNPYERQRIVDFVMMKHDKYIMNQMLENYISKGLFYYIVDKSTEVNPIKEYKCKLLPGSPVCGACYNKVIFQIIFRFFDTTKYDQEQQRPDCGYGVNCQKQQYNPQHQVEYNHLCEQTTFDA